jgi:hypothetical protein
LVNIYKAAHVAGNRRHVHRVVAHVGHLSTLTLTHSFWVCD